MGCDFQYFYKNKTRCSEMYAPYIECPGKCKYMQNNKRKWHVLAFVIGAAAIICAFWYAAWRLSVETEDIFRGLM